MIKIIIGIFTFWILVGLFVGFGENYPKASEVFDMKTLNPYMNNLKMNKFSQCVGTCRNYSSDSGSSWGGSSGGGK